MKVSFVAICPAIKQLYGGKVTREILSVKKTRDKCNLGHSIYHTINNDTEMYCSLELSGVMRDKINKLRKVCK